MRQLTFFLLLATAAAPAFAQEQDQDRGGRHHRSEASEQSESRPQRTSESRSSENRGVRTFGSHRLEGSQANEQGTTEPTRAHDQDQHQQQSGTTQSSSDDSVRNWRRGQGQDASSQTQTQSNWRQRERRIRTIPDTNPVVTQPSHTERQAFETRRHHDYRGGNYTRWSNNWRHDRRYDWYNWRNRHRSNFHLGFYYDPFGWNYRRWSVGSYLYPSFYGSRYWLEDPWDYRLPPAYGPYRWVRYWDDALLVNIYTGEVVDVIHNFFW